MILRSDQRTHVQHKFIKLLEDEKESDALAKYAREVQNAKHALAANPADANTALAKLAELAGDDVEDMERRIAGLHALIDEHKNSPRRLTDLKGTEKWAKN